MGFSSFMTWFSYLGVLAMTFWALLHPANVVQLLQGGLGASGDYVSRLATLKA